MRIATASDWRLETNRTKLIAATNPSTEWGPAQPLAVTSNAEHGAEDDGRLAETERELQATKEYLKTTIAQLETYNEELMTTNEEMQS